MKDLKLLQIVPWLESGGVEQGTVDVANFLGKRDLGSFIVSNGGNMLTLLNNKKTPKNKFKAYSSKEREVYIKKIDKLLKEHKISANCNSLFEFLKSGIELREFAKFEFSKNLSDAIKIFQEWGEDLGFSKEDLSYANISCIKEAYVCADNSKKA